MVELNELREGATIAGYALQRAVRHDETGALYEIEAEDGGRLLMKVAPEASATAAQQLATWQRSRHLRHENLLHQHDTGHAEWAGEGYIYAVFENPDDFLASAIEQGPLTDEEARGVLDAALPALRYLHGQGMVHGSVNPDHIVAVGDTIKLMTDALRESDDLAGNQEDIRQLGELLRKIRMPEPLSEPLETIVRHTTLEDPRDRWTLAEIARFLETAPAAAPVAIEPALVEPVPAPIIAPVATPPEPEPELLVPIAVAAAKKQALQAADVAPAPASISPHPPPRVMPVEGERALAPPIRRPEQDDGGAATRTFTRWIVAACAMLLLLFVVLARHREAGTAETLPPAAAPIAQRMPSSPPPALAHPAAALSVPARETATGNWRVIAFTFRSHEQALRKAEHINSRHPELHPEVFSPKGRAGYYLVALGHRMTREEAARLQRKAQSLGLPRDTYVQNYSE